MRKKNIAVIAGGDSGEYVISVKSAGMIRDNLDKNLFVAHQVLIAKGKWVYVDEEGNEHPVDKNDFAVLLDSGRLHFDCALITIHGTPGEDGLLQAYFDLIGLPYTTAGVLASSLTFNKYYCNLVVSKLGFPVPRSIMLKRGDVYAEAAIAESLGMPVFVKPNEGGSSLGMSFVHNPGELGPAIDLAFKHDHVILVEEYLNGKELTCGVFKHNNEIKPLPVTEIISKTKAQYFDFEAKYTPGAADEITPARIDAALTQKVKDDSVQLYKALALSGLVRFDYIYCRDMLYFIEVNITPGMTETSLVPQAAAVEGISNTELFTMLIEEALRNSKQE